ncbi:MAG: gamma-glutamyl-gamma-aminobutyrate hydrolase family protein [Castellaniella sp.]|uniref:gamma-glutamyl-gamma-aminobutyrate hydrolase family protein n=1 Tax=Castellaniella sp. TaxID=1955812 RepID=UPI003C76E8DD
MKRILISQRIDTLADRGERHDAVDQRLSCFLDAIGALAFPVPNTLHAAGQLDTWLDAVSPEGLVLSGGNDIGTQPDRDNTERALLVWATTRRLPVLGICRGMQMMGLTAGARLVQIEGHVRTHHTLSGALAGKANSFHNYALETCPDGYVVLATSEDGAIEAIHHRQLPFEGWMWHPEREIPFSARDLNRAREIFYA